MCTSHLTYATHTNLLAYFTNINLDTLLRTPWKVWTLCCKFYRHYHLTLCSIQSFRLCVSSKPSTAHVTGRAYVTGSVCLPNLPFPACFAHTVMAVIYKVYHYVFCWGLHSSLMAKSTTLHHSSLCITDHFATFDCQHQSQSAIQWAPQAVAVLYGR